MARLRCCYACGSRSDETSFPLWRRWSRRADDLCADCVTEWPREQARTDRMQAIVTDPFRRLPMTRASYRARLRGRRGKSQPDLVDLVVRAP